MFGAKPSHDPMPTITIQWNWNQNTMIIFLANMFQNVIWEILDFFSGFHVINVINTSYTHSYHCHTLLCKGLIVYTIYVNGLTRRLNYVNALFLVTFMRYLSLAYLHFLWMGFWIWHYMAMLTFHYSNRGVICHVNVFIDSIWVTRLWYSIHL